MKTITDKGEPMSADTECQLNFFGATEEEDRFARLSRLMAASYALLDEAIETEITSQGKELAGIAILFSGGNDSSVMADMFRTRASHIVHCNTGIGIEQTRQYVRDTARMWQVPLLEPRARDIDSYETMITGECRAQSGPRKGRLIWSGGFPGPGAHARMFQRLKERGLERARNEIVQDPRRQRVVFLAGRRRHESARRNARFAIGELKQVERKGSVVYVSPMLDWSKLDLNTYRMATPAAPHNPITDLIHMSGECLCGAFAHENELEELEGWRETRPVAVYIRGWEKKLAASGRFSPRVCKWGWGWSEERPPMKSLLCASCDGGVQEALFDLKGEAVA